MGFVNGKEVPFLRKRLTVIYEVSVYTLGLWDTLHGETALLDPDGMWVVVGMLWSIVCSVQGSDWHWTVSCSMVIALFWFYEHLAGELMGSRNYKTFFNKGTYLTHVCWVTGCDAWGWAKKSEASCCAHRLGNAERTLWDSLQDASEALGPWVLCLWEVLI